MLNQSPILITGCPRSGASMIAAAVAACDVFSGRISKRAMWTNDLVRNTIVVPYMKRMGADEDGLYNFPQGISIPTHWKEDVELTMELQGLKNSQKWMYKDSRSSLIWQTWHYAYPNAKWVIVRRKPSDIVHSCMKTGYMKAYATEEGWLSMVRFYEGKFVEMIQEGLNCKVIWPERMVQGDYQQLQSLLEWLGVPWNDRAIQYIKPLIWQGQQQQK